MNPRTRRQWPFYLAMTVCPCAMIRWLLKVIFFPLWVCLNSCVSDINPMIVLTASDPESKPRTVSWVQKTPQVQKQMSAAKSHNSPVTQRMGLGARMNSPELYGGTTTSECLSVKQLSTSSSTCQKMGLLHSVVKFYVIEIHFVWSDKTHGTQSNVMVTTKKNTKKSKQNERK